MLVLAKSPAHIPSTEEESGARGPGRLDQGCLGLTVGELSWATSQGQHIMFWFIMLFVDFQHLYIM
jgi:hypothetical protein